MPKINPNIGFLHSSAARRALLAARLQELCHLRSGDVRRPPDARYFRARRGGSRRGDLGGRVAVEMAAWGIAGHEWAVALLDRSLASGSVAHAYLFSGPPGIGKYTLARAFAQALNCLEPPRCGQCRPCRLIARDLHPDVRTLARPADKKNLGIDEIKELREDAALKPLEARHKVYLLR